MPLSGDKFDQIMETLAQLLGASVETSRELCHASEAMLQNPNDKTAYTRFVRAADKVGESVIAVVSAVQTGASGSSRA